jgi:hypothetical protein
MADAAGRVASAAPVPPANPDPADTGLPAGQQIPFYRRELELLVSAINATCQERDALRRENEFLRAALAAVAPGWEKLQ